MDPVLQDLSVGDERDFDKVPDSDAQRLEMMGYKQEMRRHFSVLSVLAIGFALTNSWWALSSAMVTGINSGGPVILIYGTIGFFFAGMCLAVSLSELVSAMPNAAGQSFWVSQLAPERYARGLSYVTGWVIWAGAIFASAAVSMTTASGLVGCYQLSHPDLEIKPWHVFLAYQSVTIFSCFFNCYGRWLPTVSSIAAYTSLVSFFVIMVAVPAKAPTHQEAEFVFATFINNTGWSSPVMAFLVGLINPNWGFSCLDVAVHIAEECQSPERLIPIGIIGTVLIGFGTSLAFAISLMFSIGDFDAIVATNTGVPVLELFYQAMQNKALAIFLEALVIATGIGCVIAAHTWQSRLCWSFARDRGVPFHAYLSVINNKLNVPFRAHVTCCIIVSILGCLYLGSSTAMNSIITACIVLPYLSYSIPVALLLIKGRDTIQHGPFWLGKFGAVPNIVTLVLTLFTIVVYSFPTTMPAEPNNMNYVAPVYAVLVVILIVDWCVRARLEYRREGTVPIDEISQKTPASGTVKAKVEHLEQSGIY